MKRSNRALRFCANQRRRVRDFSRVRWATGVIVLLFKQREYSRGSLLFSLEKLKLSPESCPLPQSTLLLLPVDLQQGNWGIIIPGTAAFFTFLARSRSLRRPGRTPPSKARAFCSLKAASLRGKGWECSKHPHCFATAHLCLECRRIDPAWSQQTCAGCKWSSGWWPGKMAAWWASELSPLKCH